MLTARPASAWRNRYDVALDGRPLTTWEASFWKQGGAFTLDGRRFEVRSSTWGTKSTMVDEMGGEVAAAERVGRKRWTVSYAGQTYTFRRHSMWSQRQDLYVGDNAVGYARRTSAWRREVELDLPGVPVPAQVFVLGVVIALWDAETAAVAGGS
ncbi:hypothetical protein [Asanoa iriomotensis]|uniref:Uncharacterized protein n=1 Tax=Asanoa iriomotensis TaxID=234613 RepID=A0ABQ4C473_9ACTN|nr:hypothetical protein [Asanoa iriomotensis]GIF57572.1 hypothetical protein Air01nite_36670 [Asanoa iriomotensis]